jgi:hypothetical protein
MSVGKESCLAFSVPNDGLSLELGAELERRAGRGRATREKD